MGDEVPWLSLMDAASMPEAGSRVFLGGCLAEPHAVLDLVSANPDLWQNLKLTGALVPGINTRDYAALGRSTRVECILPLPQSTANARIDLLPLHYSDFARRLARPGFVDWAIFTVPSPTDGSVGLGPTADFIPILERAGVRLIAVVDSSLPDMKHAPRLPIGRLSAITAGTPCVRQHAEPAPDETGKAIAALIAELIRPGDTVQLGIGRMQGAILAALADHRDLALHAGLISQAVLPLLESSVLSRGVTTGVAIGSDDFLAALSLRDDVRFRPVTETHGIDTLAAIERLICVNSVLEVDLWGQANVERVGPRRIGAVGGLVDFVRGARASPGGRSILALPATAGVGSVSRIVAAIDGPVSVARHDVDTVATEYGVAELSGLADDERAQRLIAIAAPAFRASLSETWERLYGRGRKPVGYEA